MAGEDIGRTTDDERESNRSGECRTTKGQPKLIR
jgi:hypothetical protein